MSKRPWELTDEEATAEAKLLKDERLEADKHDSWLFAQQMAIMDLQEADLSDEEIEELLDENDGCLTD